MGHTRNTLTTYLSTIYFLVLQLDGPRWLRLVLLAFKRGWRTATTITTTWKRVSEKSSTCGSSLVWRWVNLQNQFSFKNRDEVVGPLFPEVFLSFSHKHNVNFCKRTHWLKSISTKMPTISQQSLRHVNVS